MKWTSTIKGLTTTILVISIIGICIAGFSIMGSSVILGVGIIIVGSLVSVLSVGGVMVLCEISENIYYTSVSIEKGSDGSLAYAELKRQKETLSDGSWVCNCGTRNNATAKFCKSCGKERKVLYEHNSSKVSTWTCPECGKTNPNSSRICKDCSYEK